jgi:hypothetical protein
LFGVVALLGACMRDADDADVGEDAESNGDGVSTSETDTETADPVPPCDFEARSACDDAAQDAYSICSADCSEILLTCEAASCPANCESERATAELACQAAHCTAPPDENDACESDCWLESSSCLVSANCDVHSCQWDTGQCLGPCIGCVAHIELDFAYEGACELTLPEPIPLVLLPYSHIELGNQNLGIGAPEALCEPGLGGILQDGLVELDVLLLCPAACEVFAEVGGLRTVFGGPCGP